MKKTGRPRKHRLPPFVRADGAVCVPLVCAEVVVLDADDFNSLGHVAWHRNKKTGYVTGYVGGVSAYLRRMVTGVSGTKNEVDHVNGDKLDNRKCNLRACTRSENNRNTKSRNPRSGFRGVCWAPTNNAWRAMAHVGGKSVYLGWFDSKEEAALAYNFAASEWNGEFARLNAVTI